jgi:hypothetical protein
MDQSYTMKNTDINDMWSNIGSYTAGIICVPLLLSLLCFGIPQINKRIILYSIDLLFIVMIVWLGVSSYILYNFIFTNVA